MVAHHARKQIEQAAGYAHSAGAYDYPGLGWSALVRVPVAEAFAAWNETINTMIVTLAIAVAVIAVCGMFIGNGFARPIARMPEQMSRLAREDDDFTISGAQRGDEVGAMARALTGLREAVRTAFRLKQMVEMMPINVMMTDTEDFQVTYANKTSLDTLKGLEHVLPVKAEDIVGSSIDIFTRTRRINGRSSPIPATCRTRRRSNWATRRWTSASPRSTTRTVPISARC